ncbi:MAG: CFI-box-CTERM domain-containing protein [Planctomycetota bacterium]|nr:CFI-box-CTERM domain-containing protein [Planctomycetota bacterium]
MYLRNNGRVWERVTLSLGPNVHWMLDTDLSSSEEIIVAYWQGRDLKVLFTENFNFSQNSFVVAPQPQLAEEAQEPPDHGGGCFVATAAFGSMGEASVKALCSVRDSALAASVSGESLTSLYYAVSPSPAAVLGKHRALRTLIRKLLR